MHPTLAKELRAHRNSRLSGLQWRSGVSVTAGLLMDARRWRLGKGFRLSSQENEQSETPASYCFEILLGRDTRMIGLQFVVEF